MSAFREIRRNARRDVHTNLNVPALYIVDGETPLACSVRVHKQFNPVGDLVGGELTNNSYAEREDIQPRIVFDATEIDSPQRNAIVSVEPGEAYAVQFVKPRDGDFIIAMATPLDAAEADGLPVPE